MNEPLWIGIDEVIEIHERQLARFGGAPGLRDRGALEGALDRPRNKWHYEDASMAALGAAYAYGLAKGHAFIDGNKRVSFLTMATFLIVNGLSFRAPPEEATVMMLGLAAGEVDEATLLGWIETRCQGLNPGM